MLAHVGHEYQHNGQTVHCQDRDVLAGTALVGIPDANGLLPTWECRWVPFDQLTAVSGGDAKTA